jgi:penicillin-binding protein 1B
MTGMSPAAQGYAEGAVARTLKALSTKGRPPLQAGVVMTDVHNGDVVAVVGSREFTEQGFNRAVDAKRPVGSLLKPFVYLLALAQPDKWSLASTISDAPVTVSLGRSRNWKPGNSDGRSHGTVRLLDALAQSYNQATVRLGMDVQPERLAELTRTLAGIESEGQPSLILGAVDQSPYAMAQLYQFLASGGEIQPLHAVRGVLDANGRAIKRYDSVAPPAQKGDAVAARLVGVALQYAVSSGTGRPLVRDGFGRLAAAGKTGTSNDGRDSWFAGYTGDHLAVVWVGNDQNKETGLYGATGGMRVWSDVFARLPSAPLQLSDEGLDWQLDRGRPQHRPGLSRRAPLRLRRRLRARLPGLRVRATAGAGRIRQPDPRRSRARWRARRAGTRGAGDPRVVRRRRSGQAGAGARGRATGHAGSAALIPEASRCRA